MKLAILTMIMGCALTSAARAECDAHMAYGKPGLFCDGDYFGSFASLEEATAAAKRRNVQGSSVAPVESPLKCEKVGSYAPAGDDTYAVKCNGKIVEGAEILPEKAADELIARMEEEAYQESLRGRVFVGSGSNSAPRGEGRGSESDAVSENAPFSQ